MKKFLILTQSYSENDGGYIVLHKLCDQINKLGGEAYLAPYIDSHEFSVHNFVIPLLKFAKERYRRILPFKVNPAFATPVFRKISSIKNWDDWIVVYPEVVFGNPLRARNIVRWFLHNPGHITKKIYYGKNELYFRFHSGIKPYEMTASHMSSSELRIVHYPLEFYNEVDTATERHGTAYCIRKGRGKTIVHDLKDSILIDGKSHAEIASIFKRVKQFISYDPYTAYSSFAVLCGCESIVIPDCGITEVEWLPAQWDRNGIAYGFDNLEKSRATRLELIERIKKELQDNSNNTKKFMQEVNDYFRRL